MNRVADLSGSLRVVLRWQQGVIQRVELQSSRPQGLGRLLQQKPLMQSLTMVPLIYSLCSIAQTVAALRAAESALGLAVEPQAQQARNILLQAEKARELGIRLAHYWLNNSDQVLLLMQWFTAVNNELKWALQLNPQPVGEHDRGLVAAELKDVLTPLVGTIEELERSIVGEPVESSVGYQLRDLQKGFGDIHLSSGAKPLEHKVLTDLNRINRALVKKQAAEFSALPALDGECFETSSWSRNQDSELVMRGRVAGLNQISLRFVAMLVEMQTIPERIALEKPDSTAFSEFEGLGVVAAARGLLIHRIVLDGSSMANCKVKDYSIVAPTEWNFHPSGTLVKMLEGVKVERERLHSLVEKLIALIDPCVAWEIEVKS